MTTPRSNVVRLRLTDLEHQAWSKAAGGKGKLSSWMRATLNAAALVSPGGGEDEAGASEKSPPSVPQPGGTSASKRTRARIGKEPPSTARVEAVSSECPRWMHHRPGSYCGSCKRVN